MADRLSLDSSAAIKAGMSYGQYMAHLYAAGKSRPIEVTEVPEGMRECHNCRKVFNPRGEYGGFKYCSRACSNDATNRRKVIRSRNYYRRKVGLPIDTE